MGGITGRRSAHEHRPEFRPELPHELHELRGGFVGVDPVRESYVVGFSLAVAVLAPYLVRTYLAAQERIADPVLAADVSRFVVQEAAQIEHHRQVTELIMRSLDERTVASVQPILDDLEFDYRHYNHRRSTRFNLVYAEGLGAIMWAMGPALWSRQPAEERGHRTVVPGLYEHLAGGYVQRVMGSVRAQWHFHRSVDRLQRVLLASHGLPARHHLPPWLTGEGGRRYLRTFGPNHDPTAIGPGPRTGTASAVFTPKRTGRPAV